MKEIRRDQSLTLHAVRVIFLSSLSNPSSSSSHWLTWSANTRERVYIGVFGYCCVDSEFTLRVAAGPCNE